MGYLQFANRPEIRRNILDFGKPSQEYEEVKQKLIKQATYFVFDPESSLFAPVKFAAISKIDMVKYRELQKSNVPDFDGHITMLHMRSLGLPEDTENLKDKFIRWANKYKIAYNFDKGPVIFSL